MASVTFPIAQGGSGATYTDDASASTGLAAGGHRTRFVPCLSQTVIMAQSAAGNAVAASGSASSASTSATVSSQWATQLGTPVSGGEYSAKYHAQAAAGSAAAAAASAATAAGTAAFVDTNPVAKGSSDATKQVRFECDTLIPTGTTVPLTVPAAGGVVALTSDLNLIRNPITGASTLGVAQARQLVDCTNTFTMGFSAVATLGNGWWTYIRNNGTGIVTLDPNSAETIDGSTTLALNPGQTRLVQCDGTTLRTILLSGGVTADSVVTVHTDNGAGSVGTRIRRYTTVLQNTGTAITYADSATNGASFTINEAGFYAMTGVDYVSSQGFVGISLNAASLSAEFSAVPVGSRLVMVQGYGASAYPAFSTVAKLLPGNVVRVHLTSAFANLSADTINFTIRKVGE